MNLDRLPELAVRLMHESTQKNLPTQERLKKDRLSLQSSPSSASKAEEQWFQAIFKAGRGISGVVMGLDPTEETLFSSHYLAAIGRDSVEVSIELNHQRWTSLEEIATKLQVGRRDQAAIGNWLGAISTAGTRAAVLFENPDIDPEEVLRDLHEQAELIEDSRPRIHQKLSLEMAISMKPTRFDDEVSGRIVKEVPIAEINIAYQQMKDSRPADELILQGIMGLGEAENPINYLRASEALVYEKKVASQAERMAISSGLNGVEAYLFGAFFSYAIISQINQEAMELIDSDINMKNMMRETWLKNQDSAFGLIDGAISQKTGVDSVLIKRWRYSVSRNATVLASLFLTDDFNPNYVQEAFKDAAGDILAARPRSAYLDALNMPRVLR